MDTRTNKLNVFFLQILCSRVYSSLGKASYCREQHSRFDKPSYCREQLTVRFDEDLYCREQLSRFDKASYYEVNVQCPSPTEPTTVSPSLVSSCKLVSEVNNNYVNRIKTHNYITLKLIKMLLSNIFVKYFKHIFV